MSGKLREIMPGLHVPLTAPLSFCRKAQQQVRRYQRGERNYVRLKEKGTGYLKINVGLFWRLLSRNGGKSWELMHHERYNNEIRKS
ncbi:hypothetical protein [Xenorhabdus doucetiae]|uniref:ParE-like toxin domain-containing protein n=1 Tax=Xenorhabdus doucetiae TaxID=351671 RepID=A0A068QTA3_9GAMM|nr:hypothetical protein [Xenorhabdus doucetiae]TYO99803.1 hypothetical protein LY16_03085 [Xenorhabdus doucetiae]CDG17080.1 conserved hypothetical protein [Xenorhabdus doucetiae]